MNIQTILFGSGILFAIIIIIGTGTSSNNFASAAKISCPPHISREQCQPVNVINGAGPGADKTRHGIEPKVGNDVIKASSTDFPPPPRKFDKNDFAYIEVIEPSERQKHFSFNIDYLWFQGDAHDDPIFIYHDKDAKQQTVKTSKGDRWITHFNKPDSHEFGVSGWLVKTTHEGVKVKNDCIVPNGQAKKLATSCPLDEQPLCNLIFDVSNIKKGTYQIVYELNFPYDYHQAWYTDKVVIK